MSGLVVMLGAVPLALYATVQLAPGWRWLAGVGTLGGVCLLLVGRAWLVPGSGSALADAAAASLLAVLGWALVLGVAVRALVLAGRARGWPAGARRGLLAIGGLGVLLPLGLIAKGA